jgi:hypothetical protein
LLLDFSLALHPLEKLIAFLIVNCLILVDDDFESGESVELEIVALINLPKSTSSQELQGLVLLVDDWPAFPIIQRSHFFLCEFHPIFIHGSFLLSQFELTPQLGQFLNVTIAVLG